MVDLNTDSIERVLEQELSEFQKVVLRASMVLINSQVKADPPENTRAMAVRAVLPDEIERELMNEIQSMNQTIREDDREEPDLNNTINQLDYDGTETEVDEALFHFQVTPVERESREIDRELT